MAVSIKNIVPSAVVAASDASLYTAINCTTIIDKATVVNATGVAALFTAHIVPPDGVVGNDNIVISARAIAPGETYACPELVGQVLAPNSFLSAVAGTALALTFRASGREVT